MRFARLSWSSLLFVAACGNTYHPEYHPVTVTNVHQSYASSVAVDGRHPVTVGTPPQTQSAPPVVLAPATPDPPPGFFDH